MSNMHRGRMITTGAGIGLIVAFAALSSGDSPNLALARVFDILHTPVALFVLGLEKVFGLDEGTSVGIWLLLLFVYWMVIGGLIGWGVGIVRSKVLGE